MQKFSNVQIFWTQNLFAPDFYRDIFDQTCFKPKTFGHKNFLEQKHFGSTHSFYSKILGTALLRRGYFRHIFCHTRLHLGFSAKLRIWQVPACKMEPRSGIIFCKNRPDRPTSQSSFQTSILPSMSNNPNVPTCLDAKLCINISLY